MKDFADPQKRPEKAPEQPIQKLLQTDDFWPKPKKKVAGYGAGGYGKTAPGMRSFNFHELPTVSQAAASADVEEQTSQQGTGVAQGDKSLKDDPTAVGTGNASLQPTPTFPMEPPVKIARTTVSAPVRNSPRLQDRQPISPRSGTPASQPGTGQPVNRSPVGNPTTGDPTTDFIEANKARQATVRSVQQSFGNRLLMRRWECPVSFLRR
ncbi:MAG: hypothetical protein HC790_13530 [Acaryochloridaceae cyanobacterium CSU_3_4]|nr:hypothetical protein [Acaryochloridaceae cyanobacterium CSU_3_4]